MSSSKTTFSFQDQIQARKLEIKSRCAQIEINFVSDLIQPQEILTDAALSIASAWLQKPNKKASKQSSSKFIKFIQSKDKSGLLSPVLDFIQIPMVQNFIFKTGKSWLRWQLFNLAVFLTGQALEQYKKRKKDQKQPELLTQTKSASIQK